MSEPPTTPGGFPRRPSDVSPDATLDEVVAGLTSWADGQRREGFLTSASHATVLGLLTPGEGS